MKSQNLTNPEKFMFQARQFGLVEKDQLFNLSDFDEKNQNEIREAFNFKAPASNFISKTF